MTSAQAIDAQYGRRLGLADIALIAGDAMFDTMLGLPLHPLIVHATVVLVPLAAVLVIVVALVPPLRHWGRWITPAVALVAVVLVPITTRSGAAFKNSLGAESPLIEAHAELGGQLLPWVIAVAVMAVALTWLHRPHATANRILSIAGAVAGVVVSVGAIVQVMRIGHSGATAVWGAMSPASSVLF